jgi:prepilin-type N-terminal cleavage/methylation domain-containing protein
MKWGFTLLEMIVVLALCGFLLGLSGLAILSLSERSDNQQATRAIRADAIRSGSPRRADSVLFLPDGRAIGRCVDPMTGAPRAR